MSKTKLVVQLGMVEIQSPKGLEQKFLMDKIFPLVQLLLGKEEQKYILVKMFQKVGTIHYLQRLMEL